MKNITFPIVAETEKKQLRDGAERLVVAVIRGSRLGAISALVGLGMSIQEAKSLYDAAVEEAG